MEKISIVASPRAVMPLPIASIAVPAARIGFYDAPHAKRLGGDIAANEGSFRRAPATPAAPRGARLPAPKGSIELRITTDPGVKARATKISASGMDLGVDTGRAMATFA